MRARDLFLALDLPPDEVRDYLARFGLRRPGEADRRLQDLARATEDPRRLAEICGALLEELARSADPDGALNRLAALIEAVSSPRALLGQLLEDRRSLSRLVRILGASAYLAQTLFRHPEFLAWLLGNSHLERTEGRDYFVRQAEEAIRPFETLDGAFDALRRLRRRESLRLGAQEVLGTANLEATTAQISFLAVAVLQCTFKLLAQDAPCPPRFSVLALGKLGGSELNFSSDIDLAYVHGDEEDPRRIARFARRFTQVLSEHSDEGRLYRVDLRLRPMGGSGQIAYSLQAYRQYFETWADTSDRLAFLRCRAVAGDLSLGREFEDLARQFVFRPYWDLAAVEEIRWLKRRVDQALRKRRSNGNNVKLGSGGIREIEFFVQAFQMLHGAKNPALGTSSTLPAMDRLLDAGLIAASDYHRLRQAYIFLRSLEHKLQLAEDLQTHTLPEDVGRLEVLQRLTIPAADPEEGAPQALLAELHRHNDNVRHIFENLFEDKRLPSGLEEVLINPALKGAKGVKWLAAHGVERAEEVHRGLVKLASAPAYPQSPARVRNLLANLAPQLIKIAGRLPCPERLFARLDRLAESSGSRAGLYDRLVAAPQFADGVLLLLSGGDSLSETLIRTPQLLEVLEPSQAPAREIFHPPSDLDALRLFKQTEEFKLAAHQLVGRLSDLEARRRLSDLAEACLKTAWGLATADLDASSLRATVLALGKLGGRELTYHSDLDLAIIFDDSFSGFPIDIYSDLVRRLQEVLESYRETGQAYRLDWRLRPEGRRGPPATPLSVFRRYFEGRAEIWERVAYLKARPVIVAEGMDPLAELPALSPGEEGRQRIAHLKQRMERELSREAKDPTCHDFKYGPGGQTDLQLAVQYLQLRHGLQGGISTDRTLEQLGETGILNPALAQALKESWLFLLHLDSIRRLVADSPESTLPRDPGQSNLTAGLMALNSGERLVDIFLECTQRIRSFYEGVFLGGK